MCPRMAAIVVTVASLLALPALAQPPEDSQGDRPRRPARERILRAFDRDGDGRLNEEERDAMREQMGERFEEMRGRMRDLFEERQGREADAGRDADRRPERERGPEARRRRDGDREVRRGPRGQRRPDARQRDGDRPGPPRRGPDDRIRPFGPMGGPPERNLQALFGWFDRDGDNMLDRREFAELSQFVQQRRPGRRGGPDGPRFGRRSDGPSRGEFRDVIRRRLRDDGSPRLERPGPQREERRAREQRRDADDRRPPREPPRPPRPDNPPEPPPAADENPSDPV